MDCMDPARSISTSSIDMARDICRQVLQLDRSTRFAGVANSMGTLVAYLLQRGIVPLLNKQELRDNIMKSALRMKTREDYEPKLGEIVYTFALYKKVKRASIPLNRLADLAVLMVSFDMAADHESIILNKILPMLKQMRLTATTKTEA
jgi:hypothetical protein